MTIIILIIVASIYESALEAKGFIFDGKNIIKINPPATPIKTNLDGNCNLSNMNKYEMNQINNNDNNNLNDGECMQNKTYQVKSTRELGNKEEYFTFFPAIESFNFLYFTFFSISGFLSKLLLCFAYGSNSKIILTAKTTSEVSNNFDKKQSQSKYLIGKVFQFFFIFQDSLTCIHGMRFFTVLWTVMVHTYLQVFAIGENRVKKKFQNINQKFSFIFLSCSDSIFLHFLIFPFLYSLIA